MRHLCPRCQNRPWACQGWGCNRSQEAALCPVHQLLDGARFVYHRQTPPLGTRIERLAVADEAQAHLGGIRRTLRRSAA